VPPEAAGPDCAGESPSFPITTRKKVTVKARHLIIAYSLDPYRVRSSEALCTVQFRASGMGRTETASGAKEGEIEEGAPAGAPRIGKVRSSQKNVTFPLQCPGTRCIISGPV